MAMYHCSVKTIGRSGGSNVVNSAAYRSGEKLKEYQLDKNLKTECFSEGLTVP